MNGLELARELAGAAERDVSSLRGMGDAAVFADEIFGFHVQQAAEMLPGLPPLEKFLELHPPSPLHRPRQSHDPLLPGFGSQSRTGQMLVTCSGHTACYREGVRDWAVSRFEISGLL